ncbi:MAG: hypothetical protein ABEK29_06485 [Bradymonadaceae bacterium]
MSFVVPEFSFDLSTLDGCLDGEHDLVRDAFFPTLEVGREVARVVFAE